MDVTSNSSVAGFGGATGQSQTQTQNDASMITSDFETFLTMLTAQLENQDPLNPVESTDYAVQLATFSGVEQQVQTNDLLKDLAGQLGVMGMADLASWVGKEARVAAPVHFDGSPIELNAKPPAAADLAYLVVTDSTGAVVSRTSVPVSDEPITWAGVDEDGDPLPEGVYKFELETYGNGVHISTDTMESYARVAEIQTEGSSMYLVLEGGARVDADDITALRDPV
ncbi:flagellar hook capping FlgD N-terminal domain-containing protein [Aliiroseovarius sp.]|uniref:flagellar hook capping FlgD N-terminal domain-containing protein n=1 Tax=Aliiroseovarius sp. TaxID=1872442 RepID=UPI003BAD7863